MGEVRSICWNELRGWYRKRIPEQENVCTDRTSTHASHACSTCHKRSNGQSSASQSSSCKRSPLESQGYKLKDNILFQDNKSSILLETNGKDSSGKRTKHINIWFFFITDRVNQGELSVVWCPTGDMIGDFATKPLQGALFRKFRDQIMGVIPMTDPGPGKPKSPAPNRPKACKSKKWLVSLVSPQAIPQECVGINILSRIPNPESRITS